MTRTSPRAARPPAALQRSRRSAARQEAQTRGGRESRPSARRQRPSGAMAAGRTFSIKRSRRSAPAPDGDALPGRRARHAAEPARWPLAERPGQPCQSPAEHRHRGQGPSRARLLVSSESPSSRWGRRGNHRGEQGGNEDSRDGARPRGARLQPEFIALRPADRCGGPCLRAMPTLPPTPALPCCSCSASPWAARNGPTKATVLRQPQCFWADYGPRHRHWAGTSPPSTFAGSPTRILHSRDLINWTIADCAAAPDRFASL